MKNGYNSLGILTQHFQVQTHRDVSSLSSLECNSQFRMYCVALRRGARWNFFRQRTRRDSASKSPQNSGRKLWRTVCQCLPMFANGLNQVTDISRNINCNCNDVFDVSWCFLMFLDVSWCFLVFLDSATLWEVLKFEERSSTPHAAVEDSSKENYDMQLWLLKTCYLSTKTTGSK